MLVVLSPNEMRHACQHGVERYISAIERKASPKPKVNQPENRGEVDLLSCMAELSVAKGLNLYWSGIEGIKFPDVDQYEVRSTQRLNGKLIIYENDKPDQKVVLVTCDPPRFNIVGFILVNKGRQDKWFYKSERGQCWMVPQEALEKFNADKVKQASTVDTHSRLFDL